MKIWIDLSNSPHPLLFAPVARRLQHDGHELLLTARDNAQTVELARERWPEIEVIGGDSPKAMLAKIATIGRRIADLTRWASAQRPNVALSHNSYAQIVAASILRIPSVTAMDFEHQPANHLAFRLATTVILPKVLAAEVRHQGATAAKTICYHGLKEELYIGDFDPDPEILPKLGIQPRPKTLVVARTPPSRAAYHQFGNPLFDEVLRTISSCEDTVCVTLVRHPEQEAAIRALNFTNCIVPPAAIDSRSLIYAADAMIGAGGTMTREAALIGIPTWTVFNGEVPAVDLWLERQGLLARLTDVGQLAHMGPRGARPRELSQLRIRGEAIEQVIADAAVQAGARGSREGNPGGACPRSRPNSL